MGPSLYYELTYSYRPLGPPNPLANVKPKFVRVVEKLYKDQEWGFVCFRTAGYGDEKRWAACKMLFEEIVQKQLERYEGMPGVEDVARMLQFWIIGSPALEGTSMAHVAKYVLFVSLPLPLCHLLKEVMVPRMFHASKVPSGFKHSICLNITSEAVASVLQSPLITGVSKPDRADVPFLVAVAADAGEKHDREDGFPGYFNVAIESIINELFVAVADQSLTPAEIGGDLRGKDIWFNVRQSFKEPRV